MFENCNLNTTFSIRQNKNTTVYDLNSVFTHFKLWIMTCNQMIYKHDRILYERTRRAHRNVIIYNYLFYLPNCFFNWLWPSGPNKQNSNVNNPVAWSIFFWSFEITSFELSQTKVNKSYLVSASIHTQYEYRRDTVVFFSDLFVFFFFFFTNK